MVIAPHQHREQLLLFFSLLAFIVGFVGCGPRDTSGSSEREFYVLEKVDSFSVHRETDLRILDFHPEKKQFLAVDKLTGEFLLLDDRGRLIEEVSRRGEGPHEYSSNLLALSFNQESGGYLAQSSREQIHYNEAWEVANRIRFSSYAGINFYTGPRYAVPSYQLSSTSDPYFFTSFFTGVGVGMGEDLPEEIALNLIEQYNPEKGELEWVMPYDMAFLPHFEVDETRKDVRPVPVYHLNSKSRRLYLTFHRSNQVGVYDLSRDFLLLERMEFSHHSFSAVSNARNVGLFQFDEETMAILYFRGLPEPTAAVRKESDPDYYPLMDASLYYFILLDSGNQLGKEVPFPVKCDALEEKLLLPGGRLLLRERHAGDVEPEEHVYFIYELKPSR
ncbi:MAG: hypothetical protein JJU34_21105 [Lunatimonas sp.]|uniref:hypothetical protein n=1 Tax=Lunatimonas sp. TaxID=2060141 RepID=UPI00263AF723|nr:hypothetical protein [Lunatimonas sp.]MCC5939794.1 hypothetical protein [Lunatimonas sp.]